PFHRQPVPTGTPEQRAFLSQLHKAVAGCPTPLPHLYELLEKFETAVEHASIADIVKAFRNANPSLTDLRSKDLHFRAVSEELRGVRNVIIQEKFAADFEKDQQAALEHLRRALLEAFQTLSKVDGDSSGFGQPPECQLLLSALSAAVQLVRREAEASMGQPA